MFKRLFSDPSFWLLLTFNLYCIYYYQQNPDHFNDIVWLYWGQSVLIGLFNFLDILTVREVIPDSFEMDGKPVTKSSGTGCTAFFFLLHYQGFHLGYLFFIGMSLHGKVDFQFVLIGLAVISTELLVSFIRNKIRQRQEAANVGTMFFLPYLRIIPMHLMILAPAFLNVEASVIFLILKTFADLLMYLITARKAQGTA